MILDWSWFLRKTLKFFVKIEIFLAFSKIELPSASFISSAKDGPLENKQTNNDVDLMNLLSCHVN